MRRPLLLDRKKEKTELGRDTAVSFLTIRNGFEIRNLFERFERKYSKEKKSQNNFQSENPIIHANLEVLLLLRPRYI